jgi:FKBP-type peptidyl-prolyl cis-trans isomerase
MNNGIRIVSEIEGAGPVATRGSTVSIRYLGRLNKGHVFQQSTDLTFKLGNREVIVGLEYAVEGMKAGGRRQVKVAPHLAYRDKGLPNSVPPNALLILDIELLVTGI